MKKHSLIVLFGLFLHHLSAQVITVLDPQQNTPIEAATILSTQPKAVATTNARGQANIAAFRGSELLEISALGFEAKTLSFAQVEAQSFVIQLVESEVQFDEVVISATRWTQRGRDIPSKVIRISPKNVALLNPQTAADMLGQSGHVFIQKSQQGGGSPMIRGFATNRLMYTVDGVRMNTAIFRGGNIQNVISLDPFATERTEVIFGPGSVIYGSDAIGGVMSFQTLTPQFSLGDSAYITGKALARYATANQEKTGHFDVNIGWQKWAILSSLSSNDFGDLRMGRYGPTEYLRPFYVQRQDNQDVIIANDDPRVQRPSGYSQINLMQKVRFSPNEKWEFQYGFHLSETSDYARYDRHIRYKNGLPRHGEWSYGPQVWRMNNLNIVHRANKPLFDQMSLRLARQYFEESRMDRNINQNERRIRAEKVLAHSLNLDFNKSIGRKNQLYYGLEIVHNDVNSTGIDQQIDQGTSEDGPARYPAATWASYGLYLSDQWLLSDKLTFQTGIRYNLYALDAKFDTRFYPFPFEEAKLNNGALTGSLGLVYRPEKTWVLSFNAATANRAPNVDDIGKVFDSAPGIVVVPNPTLNSEYAWSGDVGIAKIFGSQLKVDVTGYYTYLQNALVRRNFTLNGLDSIQYDGELSQVQAIQNAANATVYGLQIGFEWKLPRGFGLSSDFNVQKGEEELNNGVKSPSRHAAPWFGMTRLTYAANKLSLQFSGEYNGARSFEQLAFEEQGKPEIYAVDANGKPYSPSWYSLNFKALYQFSPKMSVSAGLENLTDQRYRPYSSGMAAAGRNFILSLRTQF